MTWVVSVDFQRSAYTMASDEYSTFLVTKSSLLEITENALQQKLNVKELIKLMYQYKEEIFLLREQDGDFKMKFDLKLHKLSAVNHMMYLFLCSSGIQAANRSTSLAQMGLCLGALVNKTGYLRSFIPAMIKVLIFINIITITKGSSIPNTAIEINQNYLIVNSEVLTTELYECSEKYNLEGLFAFASKLDETLTYIQELNKFKASHKTCSNFGNRNENTDRMEQLIKIAKSNHINQLLIQHQEEAAIQDFISILSINKNHTYECKIGFSIEKIKLLLAANTRRDPPHYFHEIDAYKNAMLNIFKTPDGLDCLRHGMLKVNHLYPYDNKFYMDEPAVESCQSICEVQHLKYEQFKRMQQLTANSYDIKDCQLWTYSISNRTCFIKYKISQNSFIENMDFSSTYTSMTISGKPDCKMKLNNGFPKMYIKGNLTDMRNFCSFSPTNIYFEDYNSRCVNLYYSIKNPLQKLKFDLTTFTKEFIRNNILKNKKNKRSILDVGVKIINVLSRAATSNGITLLKDIVQKSNYNPMQILAQLNKNMKYAGFNGKVIKNIDNINPHVNLTQFLDSFQIFKQATSRMINNNFDVIIDQLERNATQIKSYYNGLLFNEAPTKNETLNFLKNDSYMFSSYILKDERTIVRHFIKPKIQTSYKAHAVTFIPLMPKYFFNTELWQSDTFLGEQNEKPNNCLINLLAGKIDNNVIQLCSSLKSHKIIQSTQIFWIPHTFNDVISRIVLINKKCLIECTCKHGRIMKKLNGLSGLMLSRDCNLLIDGQSIFKAEVNIKGSIPKILFQYNYTLIKPVETEFEYNDEIQFALMGLLMIVLVIWVCIKKLIYIKKSEQSQPGTNLNQKHVKNVNGSEETELKLLNK